MSGDRHKEIFQLMRVDPSFNDIKHQFHLCHVAKGISKRLKTHMKINKSRKLQD